MPVSIEPGRPDHEIAIREIPHKIFSGQLRRAVHTLGVHLVELGQRMSRYVSREHVIGGNVHKLRSHVRGGDGQVPGAHRVDLISQIRLRLTLVHIRVGGAVDDRIRLHLPGQLQDLVHLRDVQLAHIRVDQLILCASCILLIYRPAQLAVAACHNNLFHDMSFSFSRVSVIYTAVSCAAIFRFSLAFQLVCPLLLLQGQLLGQILYLILQG